MIRCNINCIEECDFVKCKRKALLLIEVPKLKARLVRSFKNANIISAHIRRNHLFEYEKKNNELRDLFKNV